MSGQIDRHSKGDNPPHPDSTPADFAASAWAGNPLGLLVLSDELHILSANPAALALLQPASLSLVGVALSTLLPDEALAEAVRLVFKGATTGLERPLPLVMRDLRARVVPLPGPPRTVLVVLDHAATADGLETDLPQFAQRHEEVVEGANDAIYTLDLAGRLTSVNRAFEQLTGLCRANLHGTSLARLVPIELEGLIRERIDALLGGAGPLTYELPLNRLDGQPLVLEVSDRLLFRHGQPVGVQATGRDVTARRQAEEHARREQALETAARLAGGVAHDLNNLLTIILGHCDMLLHRYSSVAALTGELLQIHRASESAAAISGQLLSFSRGSLVEPVTFDLSALVAGLEPVLAALTGRTTRLVVQASPPGAWVRADEAQIERVLLNLVANARDAMPEGGEVRVSVDHVLAESSVDPAPGQARRQQGWVQIIVADSGHGMDEATRARLFEPFFTTKGKGRGSGLGLAVVYGIVAQAGGRIRVRSALDQGTTVEVLLPSVPPPPTSEPVIRPVAVAMAQSPGVAVLLVDDEESVRNLLASFLSDEGHHVLTAASGPEAIALAAKAHPAPELLITDVRMPGMSGTELAATLTARQTALKVLYITGDSGGSLVPAGAHLLHKPFTRFALSSAVRALIDLP